MKHLIKDLLSQALQTPLAVDASLLLIALLQNERCLDMIFNCSFNNHTCIYSVHTEPQCLKALPAINYCYCVSMWLITGHDTECFVYPCPQLPLLQS